MSEQQPELRWAPIPPKPNNRGRIWLIVGLAVAALIIVGVLLFLFLPRGSADPQATTSPSPTATPTSSATPTPTATPSVTPEPSAPVVTPPPAPDPSIDAFRSQVAPRLDDALTGLDIVAGTSGQDALAVLDSLQEDAQRLSDAVPPASIDPQWRDGVSTYATALTELRSALTNNSGTKGALDSARAAAQSLRSMVGL